MGFYFLVSFLQSSFENCHWQAEEKEKKRKEMLRLVLGFQRQFPTAQRDRRHVSVDETPSGAARHQETEIKAVEDFKHVRSTTVQMTMFGVGEEDTL